MHRHHLLSTVLGLVCAAGAFAGGKNPDYDVRAKFRTPADGSWASNESVGDARFRVVSRFNHVYYGGVQRLDEYRFRVQLDFTGIADYELHYPGSAYQVDYDVYIDDAFVGRVIHDNVALGFSELEYDSRHPEPPVLLIPEGFPELVELHSMVRLFAAGKTLPEIGDPLPAGDPMFVHELVEEWARGDVNQDGHVDEDDFPYLAAAYDPYHAHPDAIGPAHGDFTGDNWCDLADYELFLINWDDSHDPPAEPAPMFFAAGDVDHDGQVGLADLVALLSAWGPCTGCAADIDTDGDVDIADLLIVLSNWS